MPRVLVTPHLLRRQAMPFADILARAGMEVIFPPGDLDTVQPGVIEPLLAGIDAMIASTEPMTRELLSRTQLRVIARAGVGYDSIDIPGATEVGVVVAITPGTLEESVAEHTVAMMLGLSRDLIGRDNEVRTGKWLRKPLPRMAGRTFGIVGLGRIGRAVVPRVQGLGMKVIACDPCADEQFTAANNVRLCSFDELLATADVVSLHSPCTPETTHLMNRMTLAKMKPTAMLINTGRGPLVDEDALVASLNAGQIFGAALDVFQVEPLPLGSPLLSAPRILLCSHMGGLDEESARDVSNLAAQSIVDLHQGRWPEPCIVNKSLVGKWRW